MRYNFEYCREDHSFNKQTKMKSLIMFVYFMTMLAVAQVSLGKNICLPCSDKFDHLCEPEEKEFCVNDEEQLKSVLNKTGEFAAAQFANKTVNVEEKRRIADTIFNIMFGFTFFCFLLTIPYMVHHCKYTFYASIKSKMCAKDPEKALAHATISNCTSKEETLRQSLFKKNIDATLSREELMKLVNCMGSVGIIFSNKNGLGTAVRIGPNFILTCWHVIEPIVLSPGKVDLWGNAVTAMDLDTLKNKDSVNVVFSENTKFCEHRYGLKPKVCFLDKKLDICILELEADRKDVPDPIKSSFRDIQSMGMKTAKRYVHVIGQHPHNPSIVIDPGCVIIQHNDKKVKSAKKWIRENKRAILRRVPRENCTMQCYDDVFETKKNLILDTFLEFGASGGAVVTLTPDGDVALVAILMRGLPAWFWNEKSQEYGFPTELRMEVGCFIGLMLGSNEWTESERNRIFGSAVETEVNERMATHEHEIHIQTRTGRTIYRRNEEVEAMDTDQGEEDAVDNELSRLTLQDTC